MDEILTAEQVAKILQVHPFTVLKFIKQGKLKASKLGRVYRIRRSDVDEFLDNQVQQAGVSKKKESDSKSQKKSSIKKKAKKSSQKSTTEQSITRKTKQKPQSAKSQKAKEQDSNSGKDLTTPKSRNETVGPPIEVPTKEVPEEPHQESTRSEKNDRSQQNDLDHYKLEI